MLLNNLEIPQPQKKLQYKGILFASPEGEEIKPKGVASIFDMVGKTQEVLQTCDKDGTQIHKIVNNKVVCSKCLGYYEL